MSLNRLIDKKEFVLSRLTGSVKYLPQDPVIEDFYEFKQEAGWWVAQRACLYILKKLKCNIVRPKPPLEFKNIQFDRVVINRQDLTDFLIKQIDNVRSLFEVDIDRIVIGLDLFRCLAESAKTGLYRDCPVKLRMSGATQNLKKHQIFGVDIQIIDGFDGIIVLPKMD